MKTRGLFLSALMMGAIMASCSSNDELNEIAVEKKNVQKESYMAINIFAANESGSRATDGGFKAGTAEENAVKDLVLVFFDAEGNFYNAQTPTLEWETVSGNTSIEKKSDVVVVFDGKEVKPASFVALLNTGKNATAFDGKGLADVQKMITDYAANGHFVMSNSVFSKDGIQVASPITDDMICSDADAAKENPAIAYVERVAAKLQATATASTKVEGREVTLDNKKVTLTPTITGMKFVHAASKSNLLKDIDFATEPFSNWNDPDNFRSYWANVCDSATYNIYSYNDAVENGPTLLTEYVNENTSAEPTKLLVTATISAEEDGTAVDIFKYKGYYYTEEGLKNYIASILKEKSLKYTLKDGTEGADWATYLTVTHPESASHWEGVIGVTSDVVLDKAVQAEFAKFETVLWWNDGKCYFYVPVQHYGGKEGVVRNHWYNLTVNSITGLGTPVADPDEDIVPEKITEETYYVAAQVQILSWKMVSQDVELE